MQWSMVSLVGDAEAEGGHDWDTLFSFFWTRGERQICFWTDTQLHEHGD